MPLTYQRSAPSNIALIKYMGKTSANLNRPTNASLSYTLDSLRAFVALSESADDRWEPLPGFAPLALSEKGRAKFLSHLARLRDAWNLTERFTVRSANNFPSDCGLASSAASFAALTEAVYEFARLKHGVTCTLGARSRLSRLGSGSSCRSFFSPWALWRLEGAEPVPDLKLRLEHAVILVEEGIKAVSSSEAHVRVTSSPKFSGRPERAEARLVDLISALRQDQWRRAFELCWDEFIDMHALFESSRPAFSYMTEGTREVLARLREIWAREDDGPLVTMDAGANVHVLLRPEQVAHAERWFVDLKVLTSWSRRADV